MRLDRDVMRWVATWTPEDRVSATISTMRACGAKIKRGSKTEKVVEQVLRQMLLQTSSDIELLTVLDIEANPNHLRHLLIAHDVIYDREGDPYDDGCDGGRGGDGATESGRNGDAGDGPEHRP